MLLNELFDKEAKFKIETDKENLFQTSDDVNGRKIVFDAMLVDNDEEVWEVSFRQIGGKNTTGASHGVTGAGGEFEVLNMIKDSMIEFVKKHDPKKIIFTAEHDAGKSKLARGNVYEKMIKRLKVPGYTLDRFESEEHEGADQFILTKDGYEAE
jgi:hypothetical protein